MKAKQLNIIVFFIFFISCAQNSSINFKDHDFGIEPQKIIWIQLAGLTYDHIAMLKYNSENQLSIPITTFENMTCFGNAWTYNLFKIRPSAHESFMSQLTGKKSIKKSCDDMEQKPIWKYTNNELFRFYLFETEFKDKNSLLTIYKDCEKKDSFLEDVTVFKMGKADPKKKNQFFHIDENLFFDAKGVLYDRSCQKGKCYTDEFENIVKVFNSVSKDRTNYFYIIRDFSFLEALEQRNYFKARKILSMFEKLIAYFQNFQNKNMDSLLLLTSAESLNVEFPQSGIQWQRFEKSGKLVRYRRSSLYSPVMAMGARAENFCGSFNESEVLERITSQPNDSNRKYKLINPFR